MRDADANPNLSALRLCACFNIRLAARSVTAFYDDTMKAAGLRITQFALLSAIRLAGVAPMSLLARQLGLDPSTLTRTLSPLVDAGWVDLESGPDRRTREAVLTAAGHRKVIEAYGRWNEAQTKVRDKLGGERFQQLVADLNTLADL